MAEPVDNAEVMVYNHYNKKQEILYPHVKNDPSKKKNNQQHLTTEINHNKLKTKQLLFVDTQVYLRKKYESKTNQRFQSFQKDKKQYTTKQKHYKTNLLKTNKSKTIVGEQNGPHLTILKYEL